MDSVDFYSVIHGGIDADKIQVLEDEGWTLAEVLPGVLEVTADPGAGPFPSDLEAYLLRMNAIFAGQYTLVDGQDLEDGRHSWLVLKN